MKCLTSIASTTTTTTTNIPCKWNTSSLKGFIWIESYTIHWSVLYSTKIDENTKLYFLWFPVLWTMWYDCLCVRACRTSNLYIKKSQCENWTNSHNSMISGTFSRSFVFEYCCYRCIRIFPHTDFQTKHFWWWWWRFDELYVFGWLYGRYVP